jgi:hypothetical protein
MYDDQLTLISMQYRGDEIGNQVPIESRTDVLCTVRSIGFREFYAAAGTDYKPEIIFHVNKWDYNKENAVEYDNERYKVIRSFPVPNALDELELTCELERTVDDGRN